MKVTVSKYLNVRIGEPSVNARCVQYLAPGSIIEVEDKLYKGDKYDDVDTWFKDAVGNYYWSGGIDNNATTQGRTLNKIAPLETRVDYSKIISTGQQLPNTTGKGVNIALLDSGVRTDHPDLAGAVIASRSFVQGEHAQADIWGHGTMMAGYIGARAQGITGIVGVAPECSLFNYKVISNQGAVDLQGLKDALNYIDSKPNGLKIDVINLSLSVSDLSFVEEEINRLAGAGVKIVVAGGNESLFALSRTRLLAGNTNTIGVGAIIDDDYIPKGGVIPARIGCYFYEQKLYTCASGAQRYEDPSGDSVFTALISGIMARKPGDAAINVLNSINFPRNAFNTKLLQPFH